MSPARSRVRRLLQALAGGAAGLIAGTCGDGTGPPPAPAAIAAVSGSNQTGPVVQSLGQPLVVKVTTASGAGVRDVAVTWTVVQGGGTLSASSVATDRQGLASVTWTLGTETGSNNNRATAAVTGLTGSPVAFQASAAAGPPAQLTVVLGDSQIGVAGKDLHEPLVVWVRDQFSNPANNVPVLWSVTAGGGTLSRSFVLTDASGLAFVTWQLGPSAGTHNNGAQASVTGLPPVAFAASADPAGAGQLLVVSGDNQADTVGRMLPQPLVVGVRDRFGNPLSQVTVVWSVTSGGGSLSAGSAPTDAQGQVSVTWQLGGGAGTQRARAAASGLTPLSFAATAAPGPAAELTAASGDRQSGVVGTPLAKPFVARAADTFGNSVAGVSVTWAVTAGNRSIAPETSLTDTAGLASATLTLGPTAGTDSDTATASANGLAGSPVTFSASGVSGAADSIALDGGNDQSAPAGTALATPLSVRVTDGNDNGVADVDVGWAVTSGRGSLSAARSKTDATGIASVQWTLGPPNGVQAAEAAISALTGSPVPFTATATPNATISGTVTVATGFLAPALVAHAGQVGMGGGGGAQPAASGFAAGAIAYDDASRLGAFTPDELIVTFKAGAVGAPAIGARALAQGATAQAVGAAIRSRLAPHAAPGRAEVTGVSPAILAARLRVPDVGRLAEVASALRGDPAVAVVERNGLVGRLGDWPAGARPASITPTARGYPFQSWHYGMVDLPEAWSITTGSAAVLVAVVDDGIRFDHPDIAANLTADGRDFVSNTKYPVCGSATDSIGNAGDSDGYDADPTIPASYGFDSFAECVTPAEPFGGHGLHVAGTIGAVGSQVAIGANWTVRIRPVRVLGVTGRGSEYDVAQGILYAAGLPADDGAGGSVQAGSAARIINMSLGSDQPSTVLQSAIVSAHGAGALLVASAGNSATSEPSYPAAYPEVLSVAALGPDGQPASYSNFGSTIDLAAPGGDFADAAPGDAGNVFGSFGVLSTGWDFQDATPAWFFASGTSMAAPHVSGVAALVLAREPTLSRGELSFRLTTYAVDSGAAGRDDLYGHGIVNARNSLTQSFAPPQGLYVRLYDASTGRIVQTVAAQPDGSYAFNALPDGGYQVFAGQDEAGDASVGVPGRRWGAFGGEAVPTAVAVSGAGVYPAAFTIGFPLEAESNTTLAQANVLHAGGYLHGAVDAPGSLDFLRVLVPTAGQYTFETSGWDGACGLAMEENTMLRLYNAGGVLIASHDDIDAAAFLYCSRITIFLTAGTYYLSVDGTRSRRYRIQARADF